MAGKYLCEVSFLELLPDSISNDPNIKAAAKVIDSEFKKICDLTPALSIWENLPNTTEPLLGNLAWQMHLDSSEGYGLAETDEEKRRLIATSIAAHRYKGTRWALEQISEMLNMKANIVEWWQKEPKGRPYTFSIEFTETNRPIGPELYGKLQKFVIELKNKRSQLEGIDVYLSSRGVFYLGAAALIEQSLSIHPWRNESVTQKSRNPYAAAGAQFVNTLTIYPEA